MFLSIETFHNLADILRSFARAEQQRVFSFHDDQIAYPDRRDEFLRAPEKISLGIERNKFSSGNIFSGLARQ